MSAEFGTNLGVGRYLITPDRMHLFVRGRDDFKLAQWVNGLKRAISVAPGATKKRPLWQSGFFDHVLRNGESYSTVRASLVPRANDWQYQGEFVFIDRA